MRKPLKEPQRPGACEETANQEQPGASEQDGEQGASETAGDKEQP